MTIDINRKILFLDKDFALSTASVENILDSVGKSSLAGKSALQFQKFRAAALTLAHFRDQQNGVPAENAPVVSAKEAELAWKNLYSISKTLSDKVLSDRLNVSLGRPEENGVFSAYTSMAVEFSKMFALEAKQEAQLRSVPENVQFPTPPAVETGYFRPNEAIPFLENIEKTAPADTMERLARSPVFKLHPELEFGRFQNAIEYLSEYGRKPSADLNAGAANAFQDFREHGNAVIGQIDTMLAGMTDTNPEYEALRDYRAVLMQYDHVVASTDAFEQKRIFHAEQKHFADVRTAAAELLAPPDLNAVLEEDDPLEFDEIDNSPTPAQQHFMDLRSELIDYRHHIHETAFELQYPALERQIAEKSAEIPYEVRRAFRDINSLEDLCKMQEQAKTRLEKHLPGDGTPAGQYPEYVQQIVELRTLEMKKAVLANADPAQYRQYAERTAEQMEQLPDAATRNRVRSLAEQLNAMHKFGRNTEEYRLFRDALNDAAENGDYRRLHDLAKDYVMKKTAGGKSPTSANGIARLSVAHAVLDLLDRTEENRILASLPTEEEEEMIEDALEEKAEQLDISLNSAAFAVGSVLHGDDAPAAQADEAVPEPVPAAEPRQAPSQEVPEEDAAQEEEWVTDPQDALRWLPEKPGAFPHRFVLHEMIVREFSRLPEEKRQAAADKVYGLINTHLTGNDINGPINFRRAMQQELFEGKDGQPPLLDRKSHSLYVNNILQHVVLYSDFPERQAALYQSALEPFSAEERHPMADTPLLALSQSSDSVAQGRAARANMTDKLRQAALENVFAHGPERDEYGEVYGSPVSPQFYRFMTYQALIGDEKMCRVIANMTDSTMRELEQQAASGEHAFNNKLNEYLAERAAWEARAAASQGNRRPADPQGPVRD